MAIYTIEPKGRGKRPRTAKGENNREPAYSLSVKEIAYVNDAGTDTQIWTIQPGGGGKQQVTDNANDDRDPYWGSQ